MSFRNEVRDFMREMRLAFIKEKTITQEQSKMILLLEKQNSNLMNRLMARDYPELQTYTPVSQGGEEPTMDFESDEELAGTVLDPERVEDAE